MVSIGQRIEIQNQAIHTKAAVRWVIEGKAGNMVFAGIELDSDATWNAAGPGKVLVKPTASEELSADGEAAPLPTE